MEVAGKLRGGVLKSKKGLVRRWGERGPNNIIFNETLD